MTDGPIMTAEFILERLEVIGGSAYDRENGSETIERMLEYLGSHKAGNEEAMKRALTQWATSDVEIRQSYAKIMLSRLQL